MLDQLVSKPLSLIRALGTKKGHPCRGSVNRTPSILHPSRPPSLPPILPSLLLPFSLCQVRRWPGPVAFSPVRWEVGGAGQCPSSPLVADVEDPLTGPECSREGLVF